MFNSINGFLATWEYEDDGTQKLFDSLTDASLGTSAVPDGRTIGRMAWHIAQTIPEMMGHTGLTIAGPGEREPVPTKAADIAAGYRTASAALVEQLRTKWNDASLRETDVMYGEEWTRAKTLQALVCHQIHHRGQLMILMRIAGLPVHGVYGPAKEDWAKMGMEPPPI